MFPGENDEGNVEYKRHLSSDELKIFGKDFSFR